MITEIIPLSQTAFLENLKTVRDQNLLSYSEDFSKNVWSTSNGIKNLTVTNIYDPLSGSFVKTLSDTSSIWQNLNPRSDKNATGQYTFSVYVHNNSTTNFITLKISFLKQNVIKYASVKFNPQTGNFLEKDENIFIDNYNSKHITGGWYRYFITVSCLEKNTDDNITIRPEIIYNAEDLLSNNLILWGAQLEKGNASTNYKKTKIDPIPSLIEEGFIKLGKTEPSLGVPYSYKKNLLTYSQQYSSWNTFNVSVTGNSTQNPKPPFSNNAYKIIPNNQNSTHYVYITANVPESNVPYTFSTYFKASGYRYGGLKLSTLEDNENTNLEVVMDLQTGLLISTSGNNVDLSSINITPDLNDWQRLSITGVYSSFKNFKCQIYSGAFLTPSLKFIGNNNDHIFIWGSQLEKGVSASEYIKTESEPKELIGFESIALTNTNPNSAYYFLLASKTSDENYPNSRRYTGFDSLFLSGANLSYANNDPKYNLDIKGNLHSLSAFFEKLSTNLLYGNSLNFNNFDFLTFNSKVSGLNFYLNALTANSILVTDLSSLSTVFNYYNVDPSFANQLFSSITWNVTAGGYISAHNIKIKEYLLTPYISSNFAFFNNLTSDYFTVKNNLTSFKNISSEKLHGTIPLDPSSSLYYQDGFLNTRLSSVYFFGVKPSDSKATDNINTIRSLTGAWDSFNINETLPVLKPYFRNIKQVFDYVKHQGLYGEELNVLIYEDIVQNNVNTDDTTSSNGCIYSGNVKSFYYDTQFLPQFLIDAGFKNGDYVWTSQTNTDPNGKVFYWGVDRLNFTNLNISGMYEIGTVKNFSAKKEYTKYKPFNYSPRKISFRTYICNNPNIVVGNFGNDVNDWKHLSTKESSKVVRRAIYFNGDEMDVNIENICFEFDGNTNDSTCLHFKSGDSYLSNVTVAAKGSANYAYGAILAWPKSTVYVCGINQIDPYLLNPVRWNNWTALSGAENQSYYPGYGLVIIGNPISDSLPTLFSNAFIQSWQSKIFFMDYFVNRRIGRNSYLNASIILDGSFSSNAFYELQDNAKIYTNNYIFKTNTFSLSNFSANIYDNSTYNGQYINVFGEENRDNFYYVKFSESNATLTPHYFQIIEWEFNDTNPLYIIPNISDKNIFTAKFVDQINSKYIFDTSTKTVNVSGMVFDKFQKNLLKETLYLNDNSYLYNYVDPNDLTNYLTNGIYQITSPINSNFTYALNYYSSGGPTILPEI